VQCVVILNICLYYELLPKILCIPYTHTNQDASEGVTIIVVRLLQVSYENHGPLGPT